METALVSLVMIGLIIVGAFTMLTSSFHVATTLSDSWKGMEAETSYIMRTYITATPPKNYTGGSIEITIQNGGMTDLADLPSWDVIVDCQGGNIRYLSYTQSAPGSNEWAVEGIYLSGGNPEVFDAGILNPGENMRILLSLDPELSPDETARITISAPNGVTSQCQVTRLSEK
jgi:hypothetical protein